MPLTMAEIGKVSVINRVNGNEETRRFLGNLGFVAGTEVTVLSEMGGNVIVSIKNSRIAKRRNLPYINPASLRDSHVHDPTLISPVPFNFNHSYCTSHFCAA